MSKASEAIIDEKYRIRAERVKHRARMRELYQKAHKVFYNRKKAWFITLDIIGVLLIILNFGAVFMTSFLVVKQVPNVTVLEGNPNQCQLNGYACHPGWKDLVLPVIKQCALWAFIITCYIIQRSRTHDMTGLWFLAAVVILYITFVTPDFLNDLGYYIGKLVYG